MQPKSCMMHAMLSMFHWLNAFRDLLHSETRFMLRCALQSDLICLTGLERLVAWSARVPRRQVWIACPAGGAQRPGGTCAGRAFQLLVASEGRVKGALLHGTSKSA